MIELGIPATIFESTVDMLVSGERGSLIMATANQSSIKFKESQFLKFLFGFALQVRKSMWTDRQMQSEGAYEISQSVFKLLRKINMCSESHSSWVTEM